MSIDLVMPSNHLILPSSSSPAFNLSSGSFPRSQFFPSGRQIVGISASASIFPVNIQDWFFFFFFRMDWFDLLAVQRTLKSLLQHYSSKGIYVCHLSVMSYSPCWDLTTKTEFKQCAKMSIKTQCLIYAHLVTRRGSCCIQGIVMDRSHAGIGPGSPGWVFKYDCLYLAATVVLSSLIGKTFQNCFFVCLVW